MRSTVPPDRPEFTHVPAHTAFGAMAQGMRVGRMIWNGAYLADVGNVVTVERQIMPRSPLSACQPYDTYEARRLNVKVGCCIVRGNEAEPWHPTQEDIFADDWVIFTRT